MSLSCYNRIVYTVVVGARISSRGGHFTEKRRLHARMTSELAAGKYGAAIFHLRKQNRLPHAFYHHNENVGVIIQYNIIL